MKGKAHLDREYRFPRAIIFDNEGVIVKSDWDKVAKAVAREFDVPQENGSSYKKRLQSHSRDSHNTLNQWSTGRVLRDEFWGGVLRNYGVKPTREHIDRISSALEKLTTTADPDVLKLIQRLKKSGYKLFILSNSTPEIEAGNRRRHSYFSLFDRVYFSHHMGWRKPQFQAYQHVLAENELGPNDCLFIDDKEENLEAARKLGISVLRHKIGDGKLSEKLKYLLEREYER